MHKISLAPVLSATLSRDSCWIICYLLVVVPVPLRAWPNFVFNPERQLPIDHRKTKSFGGGLCLFSCGPDPRPGGRGAEPPAGATGAEPPSVLLGLLEDLDQAPALGGA